MARARLTFRRLSGLDRSGPDPPQPQPGAPLHPWTVPNAIGFLRLALVPVFLVLGISSETGTDALPAILFAAIAWADYADGIAARVTGQYSRFGALLDPVVDRLLIVSGIVVCWYGDFRRARGVDDARRGAPVRRPGPRDHGDGAVRAVGSGPDPATLNLSLSLGRPLVCSRPWTPSPTWGRCPTRS